MIEKTKNFLILYIRCVMINRVTLLGYVFIVIYLFLTIFKYYQPLIFFSEVQILLIGYTGLIILISTIFGFQTYVHYMNAKDHIKRFGYLDDRYTNKLKHYCSHVGANLAADDLKSGKLNITTSYD